MTHPDDLNATARSLQYASVSTAPSLRWLFHSIAVCGILLAVSRIPADYFIIKDFWDAGSLFGPEHPQLQLCLSISSAIADLFLLTLSICLFRPFRHLQRSMLVYAYVVVAMTVVSTIANHLTLNAGTDHFVADLAFSVMGVGSAFLWPAFLALVLHAPPTRQYFSE